MKLRFLEYAISEILEYAMTGLLQGRRSRGGGGGGGARGTSSHLKINKSFFQYANTVVVLRNKNFLGEDQRLPIFPQITTV